MLEAELKKSLSDIKIHLEKGILPFWLANGVDREYGGYLTSFDENGKPLPDTDKYIVTQTRMIWGFSRFYREYQNEVFREAAKQGVSFFIRHFWDEMFGGWFWKTTREGALLDDGKVVYGQTFAIYALSEYTLATGDGIGLTYAEKTFDLMQKYCTDTENGGYFENLERDFSLSPSGFCAGDLKSLDIHMHTMEAFTTLYECSQKEIHKRKLLEVIGVVLNHMANLEIGCGYNQFDIHFNRRPAINIRRTWNAERETGETISAPTDTTSYGHNVELVWLLNRAVDCLGMPAHTYDKVTRRFCEHALKYGYDQERGGVFRDGPHEGAPLVKDKEWWQNCEVLVGFLDAYDRLGDEKFAEAFLKTWEFDQVYLINHEVGEWRQLVMADGTPIIKNIGNPWKALYHTGRAMLECKKRLEALLSK